MTLEFTLPQVNNQPVYRARFKSILVDVLPSLEGKLVSRSRVLKDDFSPGPEALEKNKSQFFRGIDSGMNSASHFLFCLICSSSSLLGPLYVLQNASLALASVGRVKLVGRGMRRMRNIDFVKLPPNATGSVLYNTDSIKL